MKDLMFKIVCEAMQLRADDDIDVLGFCCKVLNKE